MNQHFHEEHCMSSVRYHCLVSLNFTYVANSKYDLALECNRKKQTKPCTKITHGIFILLGKLKKTVLYWVGA